MDEGQRDKQKMKEQPKTSSGMPLIIIGVVLIAVLAAAYYFYNSSKSTPGANTNRATANQNRNAQQQAANAPPGAQPPNMLGSPNATVTVEEFADFQCPSCGAIHPVMKEIQQIYGSRIKFVFRQFPLQMHDKAYDAAVATEAAGMQGTEKFWAMYNLLYTNQKTWASDRNFRQTLASYADSIGLDVGKFQTDSAGLAAKSRVDLDMGRGRALNVTSTPTILINGRSVPYPEMNVQSIRQLIDAELQKSTAQGQAAGEPASSTNKSVANAETKAK